MSASKPQHFGLKRTHFETVFVWQSYLLPTLLPLLASLCPQQEDCAHWIEHERDIQIYENMEKIFISFSHHHKLYICWMNDAMPYHIFLYSNRYLLNASASILFLVSFFFCRLFSVEIYEMTLLCFSVPNMNPPHSLTHMFISYTSKLLHDSGRLSFVELAGTIQASIQYMRIWCSNEYSSTTNNDAVFRDAETRMNMCLLRMGG